MHKNMRLFYSFHKHYRDQRLQNIQLIASDRIGSLGKLIKVFADRHIGITYVRSKLKNRWTDRSGNYELDLTIHRQNPETVS